jgi:hypothetical protein
MAFKWQKDFVADFDRRYTRWLTAQQSGDPEELETATAALPTLTPETLTAIAAVVGETTDPQERAATQRAAIMAREFTAEANRRRDKRQQAEQRRQDRAIRLQRTVALPTRCVRCNGKLDNPKTTGRPRVYCSPACRKAAYEDRRAKRDGAVQVQVVERLVTETQIHEVPHQLQECLTSVLADDDTLIDLIRTLTVLIDRHHDDYPAQPGTLRRLTAAIDVLQHALDRRTTVLR